MSRILGSQKTKTILFIGISIISFAIAFFPLLKLIREGRPSWYYTHIPLIPLVSIYYFIRRRKTLFHGEGRFSLLGLCLTLAGAGLFLVVGFIKTDIYTYASGSTVATVALVWGAYLLLFGKNKARKANFPFVFLVLAVPVPPVLMEKIVHVLVEASTAMTYLLFKAFHVPFVQEGSVFFLPGFDIEVAQECSGIRSSIALLVTSVLAGHLFLKKVLNKMLFALIVFPVTVFKNGVRIVTLYILSYFVDMRIIEGGFLHKSGGFIFFGLGIFILGVFLYFLRIRETNREENKLEFM